MTERIRTAMLRRQRVVFSTPPAPVWVAEPDSESAERRGRALGRSHRGPSRFQPVEEAALRTLSDASAVLSVVRR